ncbi:Acylphosphatase (Acylphosphate phosphohydrolase) [Durusdinium trenchii]
MVRSLSMWRLLRSGAFLGALVCSEGRAEGPATTATTATVGEEGPWEDECLDAQCAVKMLQLHAAASEQELEVLNGTSCRNFILTGKVQMVHYRNWAVGRAKAHNVRGWVANGGDKSYDGSHSPCPTCGCVLGHVEGSADAVGAFVREMCRGGPPHSHVASCKVEEASCFGCGPFYKEYHFCKTWTVSHCKSRC